MPRNFSWLVAGIIGGSSLPKRKEQIVAWHQELNVGLVVSIYERQLPASAACSWLT